MATKQIGEDAIVQTFHRLLDHLRYRSDVQNVDIMGTAGFCRNCIADWLTEADPSLSKEEARAFVYGMDYADWKARHQGEASPGQLQAMQESVAKNARAG